ncbi:unnamed protein product, partial [Mytilus coruscus]
PKQKLSVSKEQKKKEVECFCQPLVGPSMCVPNGSKYGSPGNFHTSVLLYQNDDSSNEDENVIDDPEYKEFVQEYHKHPQNGHSLFVIHPAVRYDPRNPKLTTPELEMEEACTLVRTLDKWTVAEQKIVKVSLGTLTTANMFGPNVFKEMCSKIPNKKNISAVFLNVSHLNKAQIMNFQAHWQLPVFDRYSIVIQIF